MIIIEGVDNSGKTMLAEYLAKELGRSIKVVHSGGPVEPKFGAGRILWAMMALTSQKPVICDRIPFISEEVYGPILRGGNPLRKEFDWEILLDWFKSFHPLIIYCRPDEKTMMETFKDRSQLEGVDKNFKKLVMTYDQYMEKLRLDGFQVVTYDWTKEDAKAKIFQIAYIHLIQHYPVDN